MRVDIGGDTVDAQERFDKAAATQLVFEDALFHIVGHLIRTTGSRRLVLTGGTALNAIANMRLMDHFDGLHVWVPPVPGDAGVPVGAAYHFALANGAPLGEQLRHAFYCGVAASDARDRGGAARQPMISAGSVWAIRRMRPDAIALPTCSPGASRVTACWACSRASPRRGRARWGIARSWPIRAIRARWKPSTGW